MYCNSYCVSLATEHRYSMLGFILASNILCALFEFDVFLFVSYRMDAKKMIEVL